MRHEISHRDFSLAHCDLAEAFEMMVGQSYYLEVLQLGHGDDEKYVKGIYGKLMDVRGHDFFNMSAFWALCDDPNYKGHHTPDSPYYGRQYEWEAIEDQIPTTFYRYDSLEDAFAHQNELQREVLRDGNWGL